MQTLLHRCDPYRDGGPYAFSANKIVPRWLARCWGWGPELGSLAYLRPIRFAISRKRGPGR